MRKAAAILAVAAAIGLGPGAGAEEQKDPGFRVIVRASHKGTSLSSKLVADAFLKKTTRWRDGSAIHPVDQKLRSRVRRQFSKHVLSRSVGAVRTFWTRQVFTGRGVPPPELDGDKAVVRYVREHPGAIGYVSPEAELAGVKEVTLR